MHYIVNLSKSVTLRAQSKEVKILPKLLKSDGFTLIELIAVLVILSVWAAIGVKKVITITDNAEMNILIQGVVELNTRESLTWFQVKMSTAAYQDDATLWALYDKDLGSGYVWKTGPTRAGGDLQVGSTVERLTRSLSTQEQPGKWSM